MLNLFQPIEFSFAKFDRLDRSNLSNFANENSIGWKRTWILPVSIIEFFKIQPSLIGNNFYDCKICLFFTTSFWHTSIPSLWNGEISWLVYINALKWKWCQIHSHNFGHKLLSHNKTKSFPNINMKLSLHTTDFRKLDFAPYFAPKWNKRFFVGFTRKCVKDRRIPNPNPLKLIRRKEDLLNA